MTLMSSYTKWFSSSSANVAWPVRQEDTRGEFQREKNIKEAEEIANFNMATRKQILVNNFTADLSKVILNFYS